MSDSESKHEEKSENLNEIVRANFIGEKGTLTLRLLHPDKLLKDYFALHLAANEGNLEVLKNLVPKDITFTKINSFDHVSFLSALLMMISGQSYVFHQDGLCAIHLAAIHGHDGIVRFLSNHNLVHVDCLDQNVSLDLLFSPFIIFTSPSHYSEQNDGPSYGCFEQQFCCG